MSPLSSIDLKDISDNISGVIFQLQYMPDKTHKYMFVSEGAYELFEVYGEEIVKDSSVLFKLYYQEDFPRIKTKTIEAFLSREPFDIEHRIVTPSGKLKWIYTSASPRKLDDGKVVWVGIILDITKRKDAESKLLESQNRLQLHTRKSPLPYLEISTEFKIMDWNFSAREVFGYSGSEILGQDFIEKLIPEDNQDAVRQNLMDLMMQHGDNVTTIDCVDVSGKRKISEWYINPITNSVGKVLSITILLRDITEKTRAKIRLEESEKKFRDISSFSSDWFWETDANDCFTYVSERYFEITGVTHDKVIGKSIFGLLDGVSEKIQKDWQGFLKKVRERKNFRDFEFKVKNYGKDHVWLRASGGACYDVKGNFLGYRGTGSDITLQREAEQRLRDSEERFRHIAEDIYTWVWEVDEEGYFTYVSDGYTRLTTVPVEKVVGRHLKDMRVSADPAKQLNWKKALEDIMERKEFCDYDFQVDFPGMPRKWFRISGVPFYTESDRFAGFRGTGSDITEERDKEEKIAGIDDRLQDFSDLSQRIFWECDSKYRLIFASGNISRIAAISYDKLLGKKLSLIDSNDSDRQNLLLNRQKLNSGKFKIKLGDNIETVAVASAKPLLDSEENFYGFRGVIDVS